MQMVLNRANATRLMFICKYIKYVQKTKRRVVQNDANLLGA